MPTTSGAAVEDVEGDEVLARRVGVDDRGDQRLRDVGVVGQQLPGVLGQAVAAVAEGRVVVVGADPRVEADAVDDLPAVEAAGEGEGVELVEVGDPHREVGVGEELDRLGLGGLGEEHGDVVGVGALDEQLGERARPLGVLADDDPRRVEVVVQRAPLAQELGGEDHVRDPQPLAHVLDVAHRHGRLHDHGGAGLDAVHVAHDGLDRAGVEVVGDRVVVGRRRDDHEVGAGVGLLRIGREGDVQLLLGQEARDVVVVDRALAPAQPVDPRGVEVEADDGVVPGEQHGHGQADVAEARDGDLRGHAVSVPYVRPAGPRTTAPTSPRRAGRRGRRRRA